MVDPILILIPKSEIERGHARMLQERRVVGAGAERADPEVWTFARVLPLIGRAADDRPGLPPLPDTDRGFGIADIPGDAVDEALERMRSGGVEEAAAVAVGVDI